MSESNYPATHAVLDGARGSGKRRTPAQWLAAIFEQQAVVVALEAANERLKVCGNCFHSSSAICCEPLLLETDGDNYVETNGGRHPCHFKPSRWTVKETHLG